MAKETTNDSSENYPADYTPEEIEALKRWQNWRDMPMYHKQAFILEKKGYLEKPNVRRAFRSVDRADFLLPQDAFFALDDLPKAIGYEQTNSQPSMVAQMLDILNPNEGDKILDVGAGSGWTTALLSYAVGENGRVVATERIPELVDFARQNLAKYPIENALVYEAGKTLGRPQDAPYDAILVSAESRSLRPSLVRQLKAGGRLLLPLADNTVKLVTKTKSGDYRSRTVITNTKFVPLLDTPSNS
jgi:protein-L-isoaspartate(D-aspartate) O-methyltransferase